MALQHIAILNNLHESLLHINGKAILANRTKFSFTVNKGHMLCRLLIKQAYMSILNNVFNIMCKALM